MSRPNPNPRKAPVNDADTMRSEYDFSKGVRGVTAKRHGAGSNIIVLAPDVAKVFPDSESVNDALRVLARLAQIRPAPARRRKTA